MLRYAACSTRIFGLERIVSMPGACLVRVGCILGVIISWFTDFTPLFLMPFLKCGGILWKMSRITPFC